MEPHLKSVKRFYDYLSEVGKAIDFFLIIAIVNLRMILLRNGNVAAGKNTGVKRYVCFGYGIV